jgi:hypothetical protein
VDRIDWVVARSLPMIIPLIVEHPHIMSNLPMAKNKQETKPDLIEIKLNQNTWMSLDVFDLWMSLNIGEMLNVNKYVCEQLQRCSGRRFHRNLWALPTTTSQFHLFRPKRRLSPSSLYL